MGRTDIISHPLNLLTLIVRFHDGAVGVALHLRNLQLVPVKSIRMNNSRRMVSYRAVVMGCDIDDIKAANPTYQLSMS